MSVVSLRNLAELKRILEENPGTVVVKFSATWCGPCKRIAPFMATAFAAMPDTVRCVSVDIDECIDVYSAFKRNRMVPGVPTILAFHQGNVSLIPDDIVVGGDTAQLNTFFRRILDKNSRTPEK